MFMGVSPTCHRNELVVWRSIYFTTIYVQHGHFDAVMTKVWETCAGQSVCWLQLSSFICRPSQDVYPLILRVTALCRVIALLRVTALCTEL